MAVDVTVSVVGYKASEEAELGYISETFSVVISVDEKTVIKLEEGAPLPDEYKPQLGKGWHDSPEKATKKARYEAKPEKPLSGIKVVS